MLLCSSQNEWNTYICFGYLSLSKLVVKMFIGSQKIHSYATVCKLVKPEPRKMAATSSSLRL